MSDSSGAIYSNATMGTHFYNLFLALSSLWLANLREAIPAIP